MFLIKEITNDAKQKHAVILPSGKLASFTLEYKPQQLGWFMNLTYQTRVINGLRVTTSFNFLRQFKNLLPFGMACIVDGDQEPMLQEDFSSGRAQLFTLSSSEVQDFENFLSGM